MVNVGLVFDRIRWEEKSIIRAARKNGLDVTPMDAKNLVVKVTDASNGLGIDVAIQRCLGYFRSLHLTALLEGQGIPVVNSLDVSLVCGNKLLSTLKLKDANVPTPKTVVAFTIESALEALEEVGYPAILKPVIGSWGRLVAILRDPQSAKAMFEAREAMGPLYQIYYIQEFVKRPPRDIRSFVIGDEVVAAIYRNAPPSDWRCNTARGGRAENCKVTKEIEDLSLKAAEAIGRGVFGVDLMEGPDGLVVHEVNHKIEFRNTVPVTGVDIPGYIIKYLLSLGGR